MSALQLEDFFKAPDVAEEPEEPKITEQDRLEAYENGYQAGWDDAVRSAEEEKEHIHAEFARNLEDLSFSFFEARAQVCLSLQPLVEALVSHVVPQLEREHFSSRVMEALEDLVQEQSTPELMLVGSPDDRSALEALVESQDRLPITLKLEPSLSAGQVRFELGHEQHEIDIPSLLGRIETATNEFFDELTKERQNG